ncbi:MAG TPA: alpha,alpha-trehalose-phosphate synthase (UDP-forming) [Xanthobacteraceae bacterium]|nr:alpha,alpha-trehalose-phosphate synthase (UDP-forming) [Xanthobacteraceae bacterium]
MGQLVIVSNRVAIPEKNAKARAGGLEVAVEAALKHKTGIWFGWSGKIAPTHTKIATQKVVHDEITYITLDLSKEDHQEYYNGFTNRVLWPILHYRIDLAEFSRRDLSGYLRVNDHFARELHEVLEPDDFIWVHDYHLIPLAKALRERGHKNRIGFFLHIPFPPPEILTALPHHERLIPSLCEYDLVGFQTGDDAFNFSRYLTRECGLPSRDFNFVVGDRTIRIDVFPVGIETAAFAELAQRSVRLPFVKRVITSLAGRALIIGVDRLDYSKGIGHRLSAFEVFLQRQPQWLGKVTYLQIATKSRTEIPEYADIERDIGSAAGRINGAFGEADWTPIRYINHPYSHSTLAGLYRAARVGLVTPLRDGMNLVAKEYVASQNPDDPGVLILSRFAGAAHECKAALLVNPYDPDSVAAAIAQALSMPLAERRERHNSLFRVLSHNDIQHWAERFLAALEREPRALNQLGQMPSVGS